MAIPTVLQAEIIALNTAFLAASPLEQAPRAAITALQINAAQLVTDINTALAGASGALDTFSASTDPAVTAVGFAGLLTASQNQSDLSDLRGLIGRVASNMDQV